MRISDWSSDVCSSDLHRTQAGGHAVGGHLVGVEGRHPEPGPDGHDQLGQVVTESLRSLARAGALGDGLAHRVLGGRLRRSSGERRVWTDSLRTRRSRWAPYSYKKKHQATHNTK